ncbi:MAG TPA: HAD family hydrolase, partial [Gemmatimonadaceae bacterium]|nr:HAD family hydrolase [Gemmatimonadaceae bacterium]
QRSSDTSQLAIFDIDGTLTATNAVDDECYARAVGETLDVAPEAVDWSGTPHVTDVAIARHLWARYRARAAEAHDLAEIQQRFLAMLRAELTRAPERFVAIAGAGTLFPHLRRAGWHVALATGGWLASATVKLRAAGLVATELPMACADDADSREDIVRLAWHKAEAQAGVAFDRVVSVGDAPWDVRTARSLGLPFVGVATGALADRLRTEGAKTIVPDFSDAAAVLAAFTSAASPVGDVAGFDAPAAEVAVAPVRRDV